MKIKNIQELKQILENSIIININFNRSPKFKNNKILLTHAYNLWNLGYTEIKYLLNNKDNLENLHIFCPICGKKNKFLKYSRGYSYHCCKKCAAKDINRKIKIRQTKLNNIDDNGLNSYQRMILKVKQTKQRLYNDPNYNNPQKAKETCFKKRGVIHHLKLENYKQQKRDLWKNKEWAERNIEYNQISKLFNNGNKGWNNPLKNKQTNLLKRGVDHHTKTQEYRDRFKDKDYTSKIVKKRYETRKKNGTIGGSRSKQEIRCFELLKTKFADVEHSYMDEKRYPFNCDMYVPSLDLFIELHFGFAHGGEPYDSNSQKHLQEVERCKLKMNEINFKGKKKDGYLEKIKVWTESDPLKLKTFIDNNLNYKIFYNLDQFLEWFNNL